MPALLYILVFNRPNVRKIIPPKTVSKVLSPIVENFIPFKFFQWNNVLNYTERFLLGQSKYPQTDFKLVFFL